MDTIEPISARWTPVSTGAPAARLAFARGVMVAAPVALVLWGLIVALMLRL